MRGLLSKANSGVLMAEPHGRGFDGEAHFKYRIHCKRRCMMPVDLLDSTRFDVMKAEIA